MLRLVLVASTVGDAKMLPLGYAGYVMPHVPSFAVGAAVSDERVIS